MVESSPGMVENAVGKGEIADYEQFLLLPQCFQKIHTADVLKPRLVLERVNQLAGYSFSLCTAIFLLM